MIANDIFFLDSRGEGGEGGAPQQQGGGWSGSRAPSGGGDLPVDRSDMQPAKPPADDDDIPF